MAAAEDLHERARKAVNSGALTRATGLLDRAAASTDDADLLARIDLTRTYVEAESGDPSGAITRCTALLERSGLSTETEGLVWSQLALLRMRTGATTEALEAFARAIEQLPPSGEPRGRALLNRGNVHLQLGRAAEAAADFSAAREELDGAGLPVQGAKARHNLGYARLLTGDLVGALRMIDEAAVVLSPVSPINHATVEQDRAEVLTAAGRPREAVAALEEAAAAYGSRGLRSFQAECELTLSWTLLRQDPARARVVARRAARRFRGQASPARAVRADAAALVAEISAGARTPSVLVRVDTLVADLRRAGYAGDAALLALQGARVSVARGDLDDAARRLRQARPPTDAPVTTTLLAREVRAELARARGRRGDARAQARAGLDALHAWQSSFGSLDLHSTLVGHGQHLARLGLGLALEDGSPAVVLEWSERARSLASRVSGVRPSPDPQLAADLTALRLLGDRDLPRARELREQVRRHSWHLAQGSVGAPAGTEELLAGLVAHDAALVSHVALGDELTALVLADGVQAVVPLGESAGVRARLDRIAADLDMAAAHPRGGFAQAIRASLRADLAAVADRLVAPVAALVGDRRWVLTPSALLAGTPWTLLPGLAGRPVTVPTSATRWLAQVAAPAPAVRAVGLVAGPRVERGEEEVTRSAAKWPRADVLCGEDATSDRVGDLAARVDVLHLAGHGRHPGDHPLFAAVELVDGPWFGHDIELLPQVPSLVVLSACELGRVSVRHGEESVGMSAAWLHAGARTVLSSPALVADDVACEALADWHQRVAAGAAPADALADVARTAASRDEVLPFLAFGAGW